MATASEIPLTPVERIDRSLRTAGTAALAGLITLGGYLSNGEGLGEVTAGQWVAVLASVLGVALGIYSLPGHSSRAKI